MQVTPVIILRLLKVTFKKSIERIEGVTVTKFGKEIAPWEIWQSHCRWRLKYNTS